MNLIFEFYSVSVLFLCIKYSVYTRDKEHKGPILKHHFSLNLSKKQTFVTKVKNCKDTYLSIFPLFEAYCNSMPSLKQFL